MTLAPGQVVSGRFEVERLLGEGGMARVWLVRHTALQTPYALKVLTVTHSSVAERLLREGQAQGQLDHPNVVRVHDVLEVDGHRALVMDYVEGPDLEAWMAREQPDLDLSLQVFRGICAGVAAAHARGWVHRDLKPANILMARTANGWVPKVADFGLAKAGDVEGLVKTRTGLALGTPAFMAPEQIRDASTVDGRADVFALGCILYRLLTGESAFDGPDVMTVWVRITAGECTPVEVRRPDLPPAVVAAVRGAMATDLADRLPTVEALSAALEGAAIPAAPPGPKAATIGWFGYVAAVALVAGILGVGLIGAGAVGVGVWWLAAPMPSEEEVLEDEDNPVEAPAPDLSVCTAAEGELIGWARTGKVRLSGNLRRGMTWTVTRATGVAKEPGEAAFCLLPVDSVVALERDTRRLAGQGTFAPVVGGAFTTPGQ